MEQCAKCGAVLEPTDVFCGSCGSKRRLDTSETEKQSIRQIIIFYIIFLVYSIVSYVIYLESDSLITEIVLESVFVLLTIMFSLMDFSRILKLYSVKYINWKNLGFSIVFPVFTAAIVYYGISWLNISLMEEDYNMFFDYIGYENAFMWAFIFIAIVAPVFEELAFRGYLFNQLLNVTSPRVTIIATALIFALVHFSFISVLWIFPFGLVLGYLRYKYRTLWLGMLVHFIHNLLVLLLDYYYFNNDSLFSLLQ
ncbi:CPBP family intramembrane metalloprotease [Aureitalea sp. L0-47]|uniref:CPBP family glutamic-type intramembrane protease n=1 Tax=Aureitalea sp. L0-47 TaxID=2816962 RepID=UPI0022385824|nr:CPBP family glutamic-type intramembrane protease [Aureitalea sp. L0-47]MCW5518971.1 CPBP family intramembrane metalloprotease [Aureitalea sp. L0-47]